MKEEMIQILDNFSIDNLNEFFNDVKNYVKKRKKDEEEKNTKNAKALLQEGVEVLVQYKNEKISGIVTRVGEKTFSIESNIDGEPKIIPRQYHFFIKLISEKNM